MNLASPLSELRGIGDKTAAQLSSMGLETVGDMLSYVPRKYRELNVVKSIDNVALGDECSVRARVLDQPKVNYMRSRKNAFHFRIGDGTGQMTVWYFNQPYLARKFQVGSEFLFNGRVAEYKGQLRFDNPLTFPSDSDPGILPFYKTRQGLSQNRLRSTAKLCREAIGIAEDYSQRFLERFGLLPDHEIYAGIHAPTTMDEQQRAFESLVFKELLVFNRALGYLEYPKDEFPSPVIAAGEMEMQEYERLLGFSPTAAQRRVFGEIASDLAGGCAMNRLVQGDVGSGKTAVALFAAYCAVKSGYQCAMMAPTEILARQHAREAAGIFGEDAVCLITGGAKAKERRLAAEAVSTGRAKLVIGTHALLYGTLEFQRLGLIITDEQHKFGVKQRAKLSGGDPGIHTLTMSATPIPRTLALILYGSADISVIDELPPGRKPVKTFIVGPAKRAAMYEFIADRASKGEQAYVVCPLIENSETLEVRSVEDVAAELTFPGVTGAVLHGKLSTDEKAEIIDSFRRGDISILISTTVIEVGVDVPAATVMIVENAERFGLAQLHQLRGRVGRGAAESFCFLVCGNVNSLERLKVLKDSGDGFYIAEKDLELRGPGEFLGQAQHGSSGLAAADLIRDVRILIRSRDALKEIEGNSDFEQDMSRVNMLAKRRISAGKMDIVLS